MNEYLRRDDVYKSAWDIGVAARLRLESKQNAGFTDAGSNWDFSDRPQDDNGNTYSLLRLMPRVGFTGRRWAFLVEGRSSYSFNDERFNATAPGLGLAENDTGLDLHQAYLFLGNHKEFPVSVKIGRQDLFYGDHRLVGHFRWNNNARVFDAVKVRWQNPLCGIDFFTGGLVYHRQGRFNESNTDDTFSGIYSTFPTLSSRELFEAYVLKRNVQRRIALDDWSRIPAPFRFPGSQTLYTAGVRVRSKPNAYGRWDYSVEAMHQFGERASVFPATTVAAALAAPRLDHSAFALVVQGGYTWSEHPWQPRVGVIYSHGSGDRDASDSRSGTFQNLFPTNHLFYGYMDLSSLQNIHDVRLVATFKPTPSLSVAVEGHVQSLATTSDYWYNIAGVPRNVATAANPVASGRGYRINPSYENELGQEIDVVLGWAFSPHSQVELGLSRYFRGSYIKQSLRAVGSSDANYMYLQLTSNL